MKTLTEDFPLPAFEGFSPRAFAFFRALAENQDRAWVADHKADYENDVRLPLGALVADLSSRFAEDGIPLRGDPKRSVFRLNRDVRFSADKRPFKTHAGAALTRDGEKLSPGVLYLHLDPTGSFVAAGFFRPEPDTLRRLRSGLVERAKAWPAVEAALEDGGLALDRDDVLVRGPKGFEAAPPSIAEVVKLKSWIVKRDLSQAAVTNAGLLETLFAFAKEAEPLLRFGWSALDTHPASAKAAMSDRRR